MKKIIFVIFFFAFILAGCKNSSSNSAILTDEDNASHPQAASENKVGGENAGGENAGGENAGGENAGGEKNNKPCEWIDDSDFVIKLDLPEEYAHYNDANMFSYYETGFIFKSSYGDIAYSQKKAKKSCDYRVGFSREDFANLNINPNYPLVISVRKAISIDFSYINEPIEITLKDGLPEQGNEITVKINGEVPSFDHYYSVFK